MCFSRFDPSTRDPRNTTQTESCRLRVLSIEEEKISDFSNKFDINGNV